jgi:hypothetical protein
MARVYGVRKYVLILTAGLIAGLVMWSQSALSPVNVAAFENQPKFNVFHPAPPLQVSVQNPNPVQPAGSASLENEELPLPDKSDVLTASQLAKLEEVSRKYLAETPAEAVHVARSLNIVKDGGDPTNICGPLSVVILKEAGIIDPYTQYREFWLLNPEYDRRLLDETFPIEDFTHYTFSAPLNEMDWKTFPLKPGDFLYIYAGPGGNFEHMLTVNRVDETGRAFAVTNYATSDGFLIGEVMLYDPAQPGKGKFYEWTDRENDQLGSTGYGGFELWRLNHSVREKSPQQESIATDLDSVMALHGGEWQVAIKKPGGEFLYQRQAGVAVDVGSMVKIPIAMLFFKSLESQDVNAEDYVRFISEEGPDRTYDQLFRAMFLHSDLDAMRILLKSTRENGLDVDTELTLWGLKNTNLDSGKSSVNDLITLYQGLYSGGLINQTARHYILKLMEEANSNKVTRLGVLQKSSPTSLSFYYRRGSSQDSIIAIGDSALMSVPAIDGDDTYIIVILGNYSREAPTTDQELISAVEEMAQVFWSHAQK